MIVGEKNGLRLEAAALTDRGQRRKLNEDAVFQQTIQLETGESRGLYVVCDGLGGYQAGEVASHLAIEIVTSELDQIVSLSSSGDRRAVFRQIKAALEKANNAIRNYAEANLEQFSCLGTTITLALICDGSAYIANVGDSRAYVWRLGQMTQVTQDHSLVAQMVSLGIIGEDEMWDHPQSNILSRAVGVEDRVSVDVFTWELQPGDKLLLCSDGLWKAFSESDRLARLFDLSRISTEGLCDLLVAEAKWRDGSDNISAVVVDVRAGVEADLLSSTRSSLYETEFMA